MEGYVSMCPTGLVKKLRVLTKFPYTTKRCRVPSSTDYWGFGGTEGGWLEVVSYSSNIVGPETI